MGGAVALVNNIFKREQPKPHTRGEADFLLRGMFSPQSLSCFQRTWDSEGPWVGKGPAFPPGQSSQLQGWRGRRLLNPGWGPGKEDGAWTGRVREGKRPAWQLWDLVGGGVSSPRVPFPGGDEEALGLKEGCSEGCRGGGWGRTGTCSGRLGLHPSPFQRPGPEFLVCPHLSLAVLHLAASVSLPLQPGLQFFHRRFPRIPLDPGAAAPLSGTCGNGVSGRLWCGYLHQPSLPSTFTLAHPAQKPRPQLLSPAEFQPRGGAFQPTARAGERGLGRWRPARAQPQRGTGEGWARCPQLAVQSHRGGGCPRRRAQAVSASPHSTRR